MPRRAASRDCSARLVRVFPDGEGTIVRSEGPSHCPVTRLSAAPIERMEAREVRSRVPEGP